MTSATTHTIIRIALPVILNRLFDYTLPKHMPVPNIGARFELLSRKLVGIP